MKTNKKIKSQKREQRRRVAERKREKESGAPGKNKDSIPSGSSVVYTKYLMVFHSSVADRKDTLLVLHSGADRDLMELGQEQIYALVRDLKPDSVQSVDFWRIRLDEKVRTDDPGLERKRVKRVRKYLIHQGIKKERIHYISDGKN